MTDISGIVKQYGLDDCIEDEQEEDEKDGLIP